MDEKPGPEKMNKKKEMVLKMCICKDCPSYRDCTIEGGQRELGFCFSTIGKSWCISEENGCICHQCPVTKEMDLKNQYFCTRGSEKEQSKSEA